MTHWRGSRPTGDAAAAGGPSGDALTQDALDPKAMTDLLPPSGAVRDNPALQRFELDVGGATAFASYRLAGNSVVITHTETPLALRGRGIATRLVQGALGLIRGRGRTVVAGCSFVADYLDQHPEWDDVKAPR